MKVAIIDYGMGNLHSVEKAFESVGAQVKVTSNPQDLAWAEGIVLPGVGSFAQGMQHLKALNMLPALQEAVLHQKKPFLGICLGMQLAAKRGDEYGPTDGLGWFDADVKALLRPTKEIKIPHMGWNDVAFKEDMPLLKGLKSPSTFYFVHSYHWVPNANDAAIATCEHGQEFVAALSRGNIHLVQFHPEKSQDKGLQVLENFCSLSGV
jgi:glutamine amidotransferase